MRARRASTLAGSDAGDLRKTGVSSCLFASALAEASAIRSGSVCAMRSAVV